MFSLTVKSLFYYKKQYFGTFLGLVLAAAILSGALSVGSSVRFSLQKMAEPSDTEDVTSQTDIELF